MKLQPNTLTGLSWGLAHFDGIEFDLRITKDDNLVIVHDAALSSGEIISDLTTDQLVSKGIPTFQEFLELPTINELTKKGRHLWIELKPTCIEKKRQIDAISDKIHQAFWGIVDQTQFDPSVMRIIGFPKDLLQPFVDDIDVHPIMPDINECDNSFVTLKAMPKFFRKSLKWHMEEAVDRNFAGIMFARQYFMGWMSFRHPSYEKLIQFGRDMDLELGTNLGDPALEADYPKFHRVSDKLTDFPRHAKEGDGEIIAHRGTGTKGIEVPEESIPIF